MIPSSTLLDVSDFFVPHRILTSPVSIHAPAWGATIKYAEWDKIELDADGKLKDANDHIKSVRDEWAEYVTTTTTTGAKTSTPPVNNGGAKLTKAEIYAKDEHGRYKLSTAERQKALAENPELLN